MPCPTCDHTMESLNAGWLWCQRCGTVARMSGEDLNDIGTPKLVERCRKLDPELQYPVKQMWNLVGIEEAIHRPSDRT